MPGDDGMKGDVGLPGRLHCYCQITIGTRCSIQARDDCPLCTELQISSLHPSVLYTLK